HLAAATALLPIYQATEKWPRLLAMYEVLLGHAQSDAEKIQYMHKIAELAEQKLSAKPLAFSWLSKAYALRESESLDSRPRQQLESELRRLAGEADTWNELVSIYARQVEKLDDGAHKLARLRLLGQWTQQKLHRLDEARGYWEQVLAKIPLDEEALTALEQIFQSQEKYPELLGIYRKRVESQADQSKRTDVLFRMASVEENKLSDRGAAAATYRRILAESASNASMATTMRALRALEALGLMLRIETPPQPVAAVLHTSWRLDIVGQDRPGIVHEFSAALASRRINVVQLRSDITSAPMSAAPLFTASVTIQVPAEIDIDELRERLEAIAEELTIDYALVEAG
ncbi:MAG TPA: hypothetical protein PKC08_04770, partial [Pseudomonadales bacterium]|nr:hypothetical protein [Pseudomonadales bacterium]